MLGHLLRRVGASALTLFLVAFLVFLAVDVLPGDPARLLVGLEASPEEYQAARERLGLHDPWPVRFGRWATGFLVGDWGESLRYRKPARELVLGALALTAPLAALALALALVVALPLGLFAARRVGGWADLATVGFAQLGAALPEFWLGVLLVRLFSERLRWLSAGWAVPGAWQQLLLPAVALALPRGAYLARLVRGSVADVLGEDYVRTARAKGLAGWRVLGVHALRNALIPVVTGAGLTFTRLLAGAMVVENVFGLPGLGRLAVVAAGERDLPLLSSIAVVVGALVILVNLAVDVLYALLDPRIRHP